MFFLWCLLIIITIALIIALIKIYLMKSSLAELESQIDEIIRSDTNALLTVSSNDKNVKKLAANLNRHLRELRQQKIKYDRGNQDLRISITNITHDIRTPLTAIRSYLDLIKGEKTLKKRKEYLRFISNKTDELTNLTEQLFDYSKYLDSKERNSIEDVCLNTSLENIIGENYAFFVEKDIVPKISIPENKIVRKLDKQALDRILENIISNALKYCNNFFEIQLFEDGHMLFKNDSKGLDTTAALRIFDRYFTVENGKCNTGLGTSIAKQLVEQNGGKIQAAFKDGFLTITIWFE